MTAQATLDSTPVSLPAAGDLTAKLFRFGKNTATGINYCSVAGEAAAGVIGAHYKQSGIVQGDGVDFYIERVMLVESGGVVAANDDVTTDNVGRAVTAGAGDVVNGKALDAATAAGQYIRIVRPLAKPAASTVADGQANGGTPVVYTKYVADHATQDIDLVISEKIEVIDAVVQKRDADAGANANTVTVKNGANAITDAMSLNNKTDKSLVRAGTIDDANSTIDAGGNLRITQTKAGGDAAFFITIYAIKRA